MTRESVVEAEVVSDFVPETSPVMVVKNEFIRSGLSSDELRRRNLELVVNIKDNYLELAQCLYESYVDEKWKSWGYASFKEYAQKELGVRYGKASYLKNIWMHFGKDEELLKKIESVGWDKMKELTKIVTPENIEEWVGKASLLSADDLKKEVKSTLKSLVPDTSEGMEKMEEKVRGTATEGQLFSQTFQFSYDSKAAVLKAIEKVQQETGASASESLALICSDYLGSASGGDGIESVVQVVARYESLLGLRFVVLDPTENKILHGRETLTELVKKALEG